MEVSLHRLRLLQELRHRGTVTAVAEALHYTTSAVSQQLTQLEKETGTALFEKRGRRLALTEAGEVLADHAESILTAVTQAGNAMESLRDGMTATLVVGVWASVATGLLPAGLAVLAETHPGIEVRTVELAPEDTAGAVRDGTLDLAFGIDYSNYPMPRTHQLARRVIAVEQIAVAAPVGAIDREALTEGAVNLSCLSDSPWIVSDRRSHFGRAVRLACRDAGFDPDVRHSVGEQSTALALVAAGRGVTLVSQLAFDAVPEKVEILPLVEPLTRIISVAYRNTDADRISLRHFTDAVERAALDRGLQPPPAAPLL